MLWTRSAEAVPYEVFIDIETEDDLYDLLATEQISQRSFDALLLLFQTRVELNTAGREALYQLPNLEYADVDRLIDYRETAGSIDDLFELASGGVLSERLVRSMQAFVLLRAPEQDKRRPTGFFRIQARTSGRYDRFPPAAATQARVRAAAHLDSGAVLVLTRNTLRRVRWDAMREGFSVEPESTKLVLPKAYVEWETTTWEVVAGTYRIGFGQRLTFDVTDQATPNGAFGDYELRRANDLTLRCKRSAGELERSPCPSAPVFRVTPDFAWTNRLTGVAAGWKRAAMGPGWLQAYAWGSFQPHAVQSRDVSVASRCRDPRADEDPSCAAPRVYVREGVRSAQSAATYASLPMAAVEPLVGLNVGYFLSPRTHVMMTAYGATTRWLVAGVRLDYQEIARKPFGGPFGAVGLAAAHGFGRQDLFVELARSFDRQAGGGGGLAFVARSTTSVGDGELELSLRAYGPKFTNPYARPISAPDELDGLRARDEAGARVRLTQRPHPKIAVRALLDGWRRFVAPSLSAFASARVDAQLSSAWLASVWAEFRSAGKRTLVAARVAFTALRELTLSLQAHHRWHGSSGRQRDVSGVLALTGRPVERLGIRVRFRYDIEDLFDNHRLPHTAWLYVECAFRLRERDVLRVRYDLRAYLDERGSTAVRVPNPEHWLWLEYVFRYGARPSARK